MKIVVTKSDMKNGVRGCTSKCPIARAIRRVTGLRGGKIRVYSTFVNLNGKRRSIPERISRWIRGFDLQYPGIEPITFSIRG